ncbi:cytochrome P450 [Pseudonocardia pini]|uniref:cytochrome P450 n=1 Tax=Pseudonocardia pini TaxID=2758030 RepID=UPI0028A660E1|nr:cytochrome P450 [Pseudonocardia pini]
MDLTSAPPRVTPPANPAENPAENPVAQAVTASLDVAHRHDPYPAYAVLRDTPGFPPGPLGTHVLARHGDCEQVLQDPAWSHAEEARLLHPDSEVALPGSFLWMDPPDHTRLRGLVAGAFTPRRIEGLRTQAEALTAQLMDAAVEAGTVDLVEALAYPLPLRMICSLTGVPAEAEDDVRRMSAGIARGLDPDVLLGPSELAARTAAVHEFADLFGTLAASRRADPRDDLVSALARAGEDGDRLSPVELLGTLLILVVAGHETTVNLVANGVRALAAHPDQLALLRERPELVPAAVDELLRFDAPVHLTTRTARTALTVGDRTFAPGESLLLLLGSANRDTAVFPRADDLDVTRFAGRGARRHLAFGLGLHHCIGAALARLEMETVLRALTARGTGVELLTDRPRYRPNLVVRGMAELPVRLTEGSAR